MQNKDDFWDAANKVKTDWSEPVRMKKQCQSCYQHFETDFRWAQRCPRCKEKNAPKRKLIKNDKQPLNQEPF